MCAAVNTHPAWHLTMCVILCEVFLERAMGSSHVLVPWSCTPVVLVETDVMGEDSTRGLLQAGSVRGADVFPKDGHTPVVL